MNWDQIEENWQAMARRIRPERPPTEMPNADSVGNLGDMAEIAVDWPKKTETSALSAARLIALPRTA